MIHKFSRYLLTLVALSAMTTGAWAEDGELLVTITPDASGNIVYSVADIATLDLGGAEYNSSKGCWRKFGGDANLTVTVADGINVTKVKFTTNKNDSWEDTDAPYQVKLSGGYAYNASGGRIGTGDGIKKIEVYGTKAAGPEVTFNDTKTEASFDMPTYDLTVDYELVRDMAVSINAAMANRIRIQQVESKFVPVVEAEINPAVTDNLDTKNPVAMTVNTDYSLQLQKQGEGDAWADVTDLSVGNFRYKVTGTGLYDGEIYTNEFQLYEGYEVVIPAGEYVTYYKDEAVRLEEKDKNDIELCTITAVEDGKAVLSDNFDAMKANTPFLLKNTTNEEKTILLIPCNEPDLALTVADEFKGTEGACEFSEELMATGDFYVCNGKEFIKVRGAGTLAPNKAYLFVEGNNTPASIPFRRSIDGEGEGTTSIDNLNVNDNLNDNEATWYDLNGRRLQGKPSQKGIYIKNGRKVVVH